MKLKKIYIILFSFASGNLFIHCTNNKEKLSLPPVEKKETSVPTPPTEKKSIIAASDIEKKSSDNMLRIPAILKAENQSSLSFLTSGKISSITYRAGAHVKQGQVLASLEDNNAIIDVKTARIDVDLKKLAYEQQEKTTARIEMQYKNGISNAATLEKEKNNLQTKNLEYQSAKAVLEGKEYLLKSTKITAPFEGMITKVEKSLGDYVNAGTTVFQITEDKNFKIYAQIPVTYFPKFKTDMKFEFIDPISKSTGEAIIKRMVSVIDTTSKTFDIYAEILNSTTLITPGTYLEIKINP